MAETDGDLRTIPMKRKRETLNRSTTGTPFSCIQIHRDFAVAKPQDKNFVFSPCSIHLALSLIANGATGSTLQVLLKFLQAENQNQLKSHVSKLISSLTDSDRQQGPNQTSFVSGVWVDQSKHLVPTFKTDAENLYKGKAETVDFTSNSEEVIKTVNQWATESTNGLIDSLLPENAINEYTKLVLANALYFKGLWSSPFKKWLTSDYEFYLLEGNSVKVPFMSNTCYDYKPLIKTFEDLKVLKLPYKESSLAMYILLPHARDGLWSLLEKVGTDPLFLEYCTPRNIKSVNMGKFKVPKFKINYMFDASKILKEMGVELCFSDNAEFDEMVVGGNIKVENVHHQSHIKVDEAGTEAAAATVIHMRGGGGPPNTVDFVADHPFVFVVKDDVSGMVLFMGHVVNPLLS